MGIFFPPQAMQWLNVFFWPPGSSEPNPQPKQTTQDLMAVYLCIIFLFHLCFPNLFLIYIFLFCCMISILIKYLNTLVIWDTVHLYKKLLSSSFHILINKNSINKYLIDGFTYHWQCKNIFILNSDSKNIKRVPMHTYSDLSLLRDLSLLHDY